MTVSTNIVLIIFFLQIIHYWYEKYLKNLYFIKLLYYVSLCNILGVLGIKVKIMLPWDPNGKSGPKKPLPDYVSIVEPKEEVPPSVPISEVKPSKDIPQPAPLAV